jgi:hypothetical protein
MKDSDRADSQKNKKLDEFDDNDDDSTPLNKNKNNKLNNMEETNNNNNNENRENNEQLSPEDATNMPWSRRRIIVTSVRGGIVLVGLIVVFLNTLFGFVLPTGDIKCVIDYTHEGTSSVNKTLLENASLRNGLMITSALILDILFLTKICYFIFKSKTWRLIVCFACFFLIRSFAQIIFQERFPDGYGWNYPGFPSITVSYLKANDFFFNSTTGLMLICGLDFFYEGQLVFFILSLLAIIFQSLLLIFLRGQYIIDIVSSLIIAHFVVLNVMDHIHILDYNKIIGFYIPKNEKEEDKLLKAE